MTMTHKHTPGPWYVANRLGNHQGLVVEEGTSRNVALTYDSADARLIAEAPAMLEGLRAANIALIDCGYEHLREKIRAILARIDGEA